MTYPEPQRHYRRRRPEHKQRRDVIARFVADMKQIVEICGRDSRRAAPFLNSLHHLDDGDSETFIAIVRQLFGAPTSRSVRLAVQVLDAISSVLHSDAAAYDAAPARAESPHLEVQLLGLLHLDEKETLTALHSAVMRLLYEHVRALAIAGMLHVHLGPCNVRPE